MNWSGYKRHHRMKKNRKIEKNRNLILFKICNECFVGQNERPTVRSKMYNIFFPLVNLLEYKFQFQ